MWVLPVAAVVPGDGGRLSPRGSRCPESWSKPFCLLPRSQMGSFVTPTLNHLKMIFHSINLSLLKWSPSNAAEIKERGCVASCIVHAHGFAHLLPYNFCLQSKGIGVKVSLIWPTM